VTITGRQFQPYVIRTEQRPEERVAILWFHRLPAPVPLHRLARQLEGN
jgi:hypothetical protein